MVPSHLEEWPHLAAHGEQLLGAQISGQSLCLRQECEAGPSSRPPGTRFLESQNSCHTE